MWIPCNLGFLDNSSCQLELFKLIKDLPAQQPHLLFSFWYLETKICSHHEARYLANYELYLKKFATHLVSIM